MILPWSSWGSASILKLSRGPCQQHPRDILITKESPRVGLRSYVPGTGDKDQTFDFHYTTVVPNLSSFQILPLHLSD